MIDGVIKFHIEHETQAMPEFNAYAQLEALRSRLFALGLIGETADGIGYGNISIRTRRHSFFITATQTGKHAQLSQTQYAYVHNYDFDKFTVYSQGLEKPSSEALSHAMIYEVSPDIQAVIHVHSATLWQIMIKADALATTAEYGTTHMVHEIAALYEKRNPFKHNAFVMKGHEDGIITFGLNIQQAEHRLYQLIQATLSRVS